MFILTSGLGENQFTNYTRLDSHNKGYEKGTPDLELKCKFWWVYRCSSRRAKEPRQVKQAIRRAKEILGKVGENKC